MSTIELDEIHDEADDDDRRDDEGGRPDERGDGLADTPAAPSQAVAIVVVVVMVYNDDLGLFPDRLSDGLGRGHHRHVGIARRLAHILRGGRCRRVPRRYLSHVLGVVLVAGAVGLRLLLYAAVGLRVSHEADVLVRASCALVVRHDDVTECRVLGG